MKIRRTFRRTQANIEPSSFCHRSIVKHYSRSFSKSTNNHHHHTHSSSKESRDLETPLLNRHRFLINMYNGSWSGGPAAAVPALNLNQNTNRARRKVRSAAPRTSCCGLNFEYYQLIAHTLTRAIESENVLEVEAILGSASSGARLSSYRCEEVRAAARNHDKLKSKSESLFDETGCQDYCHKKAASFSPVSSLQAAAVASAQMLKVNRSFSSLSPSSSVFKWSQSLTSSSNFDDTNSSGGFALNRAKNHRLDFDLSQRPMAGDFQNAANASSLSSSTSSMPGHDSATLYSPSCSSSKQINWQKFYLKNGKDNALHFAARLGKTDLIHILLDTGHFDVNEKNNSEEADTALTIACDLGWLDTAKLLIDRGADVNYENRKNKTPLILATELVLPFDMLICKMLLNRGASVNARARNGNTVLLNATKYGNVEIVRGLIRAKTDVNQAFTDGTTPLMRACYYNYYNLAADLLDNGADIEAHNARRETALYIASFRGNLEIVELLVQQYKANINCRDLDGDTPLSVACYEEKTRVINFLLSNGACVNINGIRGDTPLHIAVSNCSNEIVRQVIESGAHVDALNNDNETPLHIAARHSRIETIQTLLEHAKCLDVVSHYRTTPFKNLIVSLQREKVIMAICLMKAGCDVNLSFNNDEAGLSTASEQPRHASTLAPMSPFEYIIKFCDERCSQIQHQQSIIEAFNPLDDLNSLFAAPSWSAIKPAALKETSLVLSHVVYAIELLIRSGYKPNAADLNLYKESQFRTGYLPCHEPRSLALLDKLLIDDQTRPLPLADICRLKVRKLIQKPMSVSVKSLHIPCHLERFLFLE